MNRILDHGLIGRGCGVIIPILDMSNDATDIVCVFLLHVSHIGAKFWLDGVGFGEENTGSMVE